MISLESNPPERMPDYCIQRHKCLVDKRARCPIECGPRDFIKGDKHLSPWSRQHAHPVDLTLYLRRKDD